MISKVLIPLGLVSVGCIALLLWASAPKTIDSASLPSYVADKANGEVLYHAGGCISCHKPRSDIAGLDTGLPSGGSPLATPLGTLYPPNLTPDQETGIGGWSDRDFVDAVKYGVSPQGENYIPAFPYTSYRHMTDADVLDLKAYLMSLRPVRSENRQPGLAGSWVVRRGIGIWKRLALDDAPVANSPDKVVMRGAYLVNGPGHCAECHTPRGAFMIADPAKALAGGPHPSGNGAVPSLRDLIGRGVFQDTADLASALKEGESGGYEHMSKGGMGEVQANLGQLPDADIAAIASYLASLK